MQTKPLIYSLVSRGHQTILSSFSRHSGNFPSIALDVLHKCNLSKIFGQYATENFCFYTLAQNGFVFLVMVDASYKTRIAISFLKTVKEQFYSKYNYEVRASANAHSLTDFNKVLERLMKKFDNPADVDKFSELEKELSELESQSLKNLDKVILRGEKITALLEKSEQMNNVSTDMVQQSKKVKLKMWCQNKKVMLGIVLFVVVVLVIIIAVLAS